jgi:pimeloyl-ACP methyl ester carboxylesterase
VVIGHSVGGLTTQILANKGLLSCGIAVDSAAPNAMKARADRDRP